MVSINGTNISVTRGDTLDISIEILYPDGSPYTVLAENLCILRRGSGPRE